jgi:hypothetical protein
VRGWSSEALPVLRFIVSILTISTLRNRTVMLRAAPAPRLPHRPSPVARLPEAPRAPRLPWSPRTPRGAPTLAGRASRPCPLVRPPILSLWERAYRGLSPCRGVKPGPYSGAKAGASPRYKNGRCRPFPCVRRRRRVWHTAATAPYLQSIPQPPTPLTLVSLH